LRKLPLTIIHQKGVNHIRRRLWTPAPDPSPQGGGVKRRIRIKALVSRSRRRDQAALPASVWTQASPQAFANSRTRMM
jgi:hypothetical protein